MPDFEVLLQPQGKVLQDFWDCESFVQIIIGPLGSGKTILTCNKIIELMRKQKPNAQGVRKSRWLAARNTYSELFTTTIKDWLECNGYLGAFTEGSKKPPIHKLNFKLEDGTTVESELIFVAFDRPDHVKKARGMQLTGVWCNEIKEMPKAVIDMLTLRIGRYPSKKEGTTPTWYGMLGDCNAPDEDHWLYKLAEEDRPKDWTIFKQPGGLIKAEDEWSENPLAENLKNLPRDYYMKGLQGKDEDWISVNLANEYGFTSDGKAVHPRYIDSVHCIHMNFTPSYDFPIILGFDFGRMPACSFMQETPTGGYICFDEFVAEDMSAATFAPELSKYIKKNYQGYKFKGWGDPAGEAKGQATERTPFSVLRDNGIPARPAPKKNSPLLRRSAIEFPLTQMDMAGKPRLIILPKAKMIRKGLAGAFCYRRVQVGGEARYSDEPDKNKYSHPVEALEYALQGVGEGKKPLSKSFESKWDDWNVPVNY